MNIKIEGWKVTIHNENGDRLELKGEFEAGFFKEYENKQLIITDVVGRSEELVCPNCDGEGFSGKGTNEILPCLSCFGSGERTD